MLTKKLSILVLILLLNTDVILSETPATSELLETEAGELVLYQSIVINTSIDKVWNAYTTSEGWMTWVAPKAKVDLKIGGLIQTQYDPKANIGDPGTNTLRIINYVPMKVLTMQADLSERWPEVMKRDAKDLMNVVIFKEISDDQVQIDSYGVGYRKSPEYDNLMKFFIPANEQLLTNLKTILEKES